MEVRSQEEEGQMGSGERGLAPAVLILAKIPHEKLCLR